MQRLPLAETRPAAAPGSEASVLGPPADDAGAVAEYDEIHASLDLTAWAGPWGVSYGANLSPDPETGLKKRYTEASFIKTLRTGKKPEGEDLLPPMPWELYKVFSDDDIKAIWAYLQTIPAIKNNVKSAAPALKPWLRPQRNSQQVESGGQRSGQTFSLVPGLRSRPPTTGHRSPAVPCKICVCPPNWTSARTRSRSSASSRARPSRRPKFTATSSSTSPRNPSSGEAQNLKEYTVGLDVFGKPASYDPRQESVVRMHVGRLRQKLTEYYRTEGVEDPVIVDLPKGGFALTFAPRPVAVEPEVAPPVVPARTISHRRDRAGRVAGLALVAAGYFGVRLLGVEKTTGSAVTARRRHGRRICRNCGRRCCRRTGR